jgi:cytochrome c biogenesis protein CcdA
MIDWPAFLLVGVVALVSACVVVTVAALGFRLLETGKSARQSGESGRISLAVARALFAVCALVVLFGVYLIVPAFH